MRDEARAADEELARCLNGLQCLRHAKVRRFRGGGFAPRPVRWVGARSVFRLR